MTDLSEFGAGIDSSQTTTETGGVRRHDCKAITESGTQCENTPTGREELCTVHEDAYRIRRVDEFDATPAPQLRDTLRDECGIPGRRAYALATLADTARTLWNRLTDHDAAPIELGEQTLSFGTMVDYAAEVADHPELSVEGELFAQQTCIAKTNRDKRCSFGASGVLRLCNTHQTTKTVTVVREVRHRYAELRDDPSIDTAR